ncbi:hypothetical protein BD779DRAFT_1677891 [Infundibulicybe gibba]|nr:hypothetical protein BD779DRAFT_1677891 [Infundibulicybe gibba]
MPFALPPHTKPPPPTTLPTSANSLKELFRTPWHASYEPRLSPVDVLRHLSVSPAETLQSIVRHCDNVTYLAIAQQDLTPLANIRKEYEDEMHIIVFEEPMHEDWEPYRLNGMIRSLFGRAAHPRPRDPA